ncbi:MAG: T9SS type A sorting domain-containing protein [Bacteroidota bacterium]|nr:T9SS type A sorting domain-containing protein [Bacteroidota bacterium]
MKLLFKIILLFGFVLSPQSYLNAQPITWQKVLYYTDNSALDKVHQTKDEGFVAVGTSRVGGYGKIILIKFNKYGDTIWNKYFDLNVNAVYRGLWLDKTFDGGFIISGSGEGPGTDAYLIKTDSSGNILWYRTFGGLDLDQSKCVRQLPDNGFILLVRTFSFNSTADILLIRTDSSGNEIWRKIYGNSTYDEIGNEIQIIGNCGFIIAGWKQIINQPANLYLIRSDIKGDTLWTRTFNSYLVSGAYSIDITNDNGFIIGGAADSTNNNEPMAYVIKTDSLGKIDWQRRYSTGFKEYSFSIRALPNNKYAFCGMSDSSFGNYERAILRIIDGTGISLVEKYFRPGFNNAFHSLELTKDNGFILCGYADFDATLSFIVRTDSIGSVKPVGITNSGEIINNFTLCQNYPNPFNPTTIINYHVVVSSFISLKVFDVLGKEVATLVNQKQNAGSYSVDFDGSNLSNGIYFYKIEADNFIETKRMVLVK